MNNTLATLDLSDLSSVTGGAGALAALGAIGGNVEVKADANELVRDVGTGAGRLLGCATGADSMREFGNCILTGKLGDVPQSSSTSSSSAGE